MRRRAIAGFLAVAAMSFAAGFTPVAAQEASPPIIKAGGDTFPATQLVKSPAISNRSEAGFTATVYSARSEQYIALRLHCGENNRAQHTTTTTTTTRNL